jgi:hypothetical protein
MATTEQLIASLTSATTDLINQVVIQKLSIDESKLLFNDIISRVNNELDRVNNTSDAEKPISDLTLEELNKKVSKEDLVTINGKSITGGEPLVIARSKTELETLTYENRGILRYPIQPLPAADDSVVIEGIGLLIFVDSFTEPDDDETSFTAVDPLSLLPIGQWLLNVPAPDLISAWSTDDRNLRDELDEDETGRLTSFFVTK